MNKSNKSQARKRNKNSRKKSEFFFWEKGRQIFAGLGISLVIGLSLLSASGFHFHLWSGSARVNAVVPASIYRATPVHQKNHPPDPHRDGNPAEKTLMAGLWQFARPDGKCLASGDNENQALNGFDPNYNKNSLNAGDWSPKDFRILGFGEVGPALNLGLIVNIQLWAVLAARSDAHPAPKRGTLRQLPRPPPSLT